jgi:hypothetical protein
MTDDRTIQIAERMSRRRGRILFLQGALFLVWQGSFYAWGAETGGDRLVDQVKVSAWAVWVLALLVMMATGGGWLRGREVRRLMNDEVSVDNRRRGQQAGFFAAALGGLAVYAVNQYVEPVSTLDAIHATLSVGVAVAILRYAMLERRAERG